VSGKERAYRTCVCREAKESGQQVPASPVGDPNKMLAKETLDAPDIRVAKGAQLNRGVPKGKSRVEMKGVVRREHGLGQRDKSRVKRVVLEWERGVGRRGRKGRVWNRKQTTVEGGVTEVADGGERRRRRHQDVVDGERVGREALKKPQPRPVFDRRPGGECSGEEDVQGGRRGVDGRGENK
jgi:hypothetical protein